MWFMFERVEIELPHANSAVEGWHRVFQHTVGYADPTNCKLFESIQLEHSHYVNRKTKIDAGPNIVKNKKKCICFSVGPQRLLKNFLDQDLRNYLRSISYNINLNV